VENSIVHNLHLLDTFAHHYHSFLPHQHQNTFLHPALNKADNTNLLQQHKRKRTHEQQMSNSSGRPVTPGQPPGKGTPPTGKGSRTGAISVDNKGYVKGLKKTKYDKMVTDKAEAENDLRTAEDSVRNQEDILSQQDTEIARLEGEVTEAREEAVEAQEEAAALKRQNTTLQTTLAGANQALKDAGRHSKKEEKKDIKKAISRWIKDVGFRNTKFAKGDKLTRFAKTIYSRIKGDLHLMDDGHDHYTPEVEFVRIYEPYIQTVLGERRQYVQTMLFEVAKSKSWYFVFAPKFRVSCTKLFCTSLKNGGRSTEACLQLNGSRLCTNCPRPVMTTSKSDQSSKSFTKTYGCQRQLASKTLTQTSVITGLQ
jgi:hypothetical protein